MSLAKPIMVEVAPGELIDKITILQIKCERMDDAEKLKNVRVELEVLEAARDSSMGKSDQLDALSQDLKAVNEALWEIEDQIRDCERNKDLAPISSSWPGRSTTPTISELR